MNKKHILIDEWQYALSFLPGDLDASCHEKLAMARQRQILSAADLLRLCMAYGFCDMSLRQTAAWAATIGLAQMSNVAVLKRITKAADWLGHLIVGQLIQRGCDMGPADREIRIVDGSSLSGPGSRGTDWRLHMEVDPVRQRISHVEITDSKKGESLQTHPVVSGILYLADRGYSTRASILSLLRRGGHVLCRAQVSTLSLENEQRQRIDAVPLLETLADHEMGDWPVWVSDRSGRHRLRLIAIRKTPQATQREIKRVKAIASNKGKKFSQHSRKMAGYTCVVTDLDTEALAAARALNLYRVRWQIELMFKRLKSLIHLGDLRAKSPQAARAIIFAKILGALLVEDLTKRALSFFPWGFRLREPPSQPLASLQILDRRAQERSEE